MTLLLTALTAEVRFSTPATTFSGSCLALAYVFCQTPIGVSSLHENWALYQGTTLVVPKFIAKEEGFYSPCWGPDPTNLVVRT
jgi:hypothetical protein